MSKQAIKTTYHGQSNTRPSRIVASAAGRSFSFAYDDALTTDANHNNAAEAVAAKFKWPGVLVAGVFNGHYFHVFIS